MIHFFFIFLYIFSVSSFFFPPGLARPGLSGARLSGLQCSKCDDDTSVAFVDKLAIDLNLCLNTTLTLKAEKLSCTFLLAVSRQDLQDVYLIDPKDALKLIVWAQRKARDKELEAQRKAREEKLNLAKSVFIYNSLDDIYMYHDFIGQRDVTSLLDKWQSAGLIISGAASDGDEHESSSSSEILPHVISHLENLVNGSHYHHVGLPKSLAKRLQDDLAAEACVKADYNSASLLTKHFGEEIVYRASRVDLTEASTGNSLGDIDTLFSSRNGSIVVLLERKGSLSIKSLDSLVGQVQSTKAAFSACATRGDTALTTHVGSLAVDILQAKVYSAVYCKAGPDEVFQRLREVGVFVIKDGVELLAPA